MFENVVLLIPSLDPDTKLIRTVESLIREGFVHVLLVNDGSDKDHLVPFDVLSKHPEVTVIGYEVNRGKGYALKYGFDYVLKNYPGAAGVLTADGDGQHLASDCANTAEAMLQRDEVVLGCRNFKDPSVPGHNKFGNTISIFAYSFLCGIKVSDTQTGLRAVPVRYLKDFCDVEGARFEYETNMLIYMKDKGIPFSEVSITTVYEEDSNAGSHFRIFSDSAKIYKPLLKYGGPRFIKFMCGSLLSTLIDLGLFTIIGLFTESVFIATAPARVVSSIFNYCFNRGAVFKNSGSAKGSILRYYLLAACIMCASSLMVSVFSKLFSAAGLVRTVVKFIVDLILFFVSFKVQKDWVFK